MARSSPRQRKTMGRVMHEFKHGELKSGRAGRAGKVKNRRQAIAIALKEAGASKYASARENRRNRARSARKEAHGATYQQEREGRSHVGARGRRESSRAMGGRNARKITARGRRAARGRARKSGGATKAQLYRRAKARSVPGRSKMSKQQLATLILLRHSRLEGRCRGGFAGTQKKRSVFWNPVPPPRASRRIARYRAMLLSMREAALRRVQHFPAGLRQLGHFGPRPRM